MSKMTEFKFSLPTQTVTNQLMKQPQAEGSGGDNVFCDGFSVAERMRADFPAQFELLRISSGDRRIFLPIDILGVISFSQTTNS